MLILLSFLIVLISGLLLRAKKRSAGLNRPRKSDPYRGRPSCHYRKSSRQPATLKPPEPTHGRMWTGWTCRPDKGVVRVRGTNGWEVQMDAHTGEALHVEPHGSDVIEAIHDGS